MIWFFVVIYSPFICVMFSVRIKCRDLVKKIAIYRNRLAVRSVACFCDFLPFTFLLLLDGTLFSVVHFLSLIKKKYKVL